MQLIAAEHQREIRFAALSGREQDKHRLTKTELEQAGYGQYFSEYLLNEGQRSAIWKYQKVKIKMEQGFSLVHLEDDLTPALLIGKLGALVYLFENLSNHPLLLWMNQITLPSQVVPVKGFDQVVEDFRSRVSGGYI